MTIWTQQSGNYRDESDELQEQDRFERISYRRDGECPVRSHASRTRARMRSRGGAAARQKGRTINGAHRRRTRRMSAPL